MRTTAAVGFVLVAVGVLFYGVMSAFGDDREPLPLTGCQLCGSVTYNGQPVPMAVVLVTGTAPGGGAVTGVCDDDGRYVIENVPPGPVRIGVNTDAARGMMMGRSMAGVDPTKSGGRRSPPRVVDVPKRFHDPNTSGIGTTVKSGSNQHDISLKS